MPFFDFASGGFSRRVHHYQHGYPDAVIVLHGGDMDGPAMLAAMAYEDPDVSYYAMDALVWSTDGNPGSGTNRHWIQPWKVTWAGFPGGATGSTDLDAIRDLIALLVASHGAERVVVLGFSAGGLMTLYAYQQGTAAAAYGAASCTLHGSQLDTAGHFVVAAVKPLLWLCANGDSVAPSGVGHVTVAAMRPILEWTHGATGYSLIGFGSTCGRSLKWATYTGFSGAEVRPYSVIDSAHRWYSCSAAKATEALFVDLCRDSGALL